MTINPWRGIMRYRERPTFNEETEALDHALAALEYLERFGSGRIRRIARAVLPFLRPCSRVRWDTLLLFEARAAVDVMQDEPTDEVLDADDRMWRALGRDR